MRLGQSRKMCISKFSDTKDICRKRPTINPILEEYITTARYRVRLVRERQVISDLQAGGLEEFVVVDRISLAEENDIVQKKRQCGYESTSLHVTATLRQFTEMGKGLHYIYIYLRKGRTLTMFTRKHRPRATRESVV